MYKQTTSAALFETARSCGFLNNNKKNIVIIVVIDKNKKKYLKNGLSRNRL